MKKKIVVIGGGPAGMIAAGRAAELGVSVVLLEKNQELGIKLLITGKGRCNITNNSDDTRVLVNKFGKNGNFLFSSLHKFGVGAVVAFFEGRGLKTKVERGNRIFPVSDSSRDVLEELIKYMREGKVEIRKNSEVEKIVKKDNKIEKIVLTSGEEIVADRYVIATGGKSYPATGSTGDGFRWLEDMGHIVHKPIPALVPIVVREKIVRELEGLSLKNVEISIVKNNKKIDSRFGEALFTRDGMSGPIILDISKRISEELPAKMDLKIDFKPALDFKMLDERIQRDFSENSNKLFRNSLNQLLPQKLIPVIIKMSRIDEDKKVNLITREERKKLIHLLKEFTLSVKGVTGFSKAIITAGGVTLSEVDPKTCKSKLIDNLYIVGEVLDLDGPTGGYNLQVCWSTGYTAGEAVAD